MTDSAGQMNLLGARGLGVFPKSVAGAENSAEGSLWHRVLQLEFRIHSLDNVVDMEQETLALLLGEAEQVVRESDSGPLENFSARLSYAVVLLKSERYSAVVELLLNKANGSTQVGNEYLGSLKFKERYLLARAYKGLGEVQNWKDCVLSGLNLYETVPNLSNIESRHWLGLLFDEFIETFSFESLTMDQLRPVFKNNENFILTFVCHVKGNEFSSQFKKDLIQYVNSRSNELLKASKFPRSNETNNPILEEFVQELTRVATTTTLIQPSSIQDIIDAAISKTYQSQILLDSLSRVLFFTGSEDAIKAAFEVYENYVHSYYVLHEKQYSDYITTVSLIRDLLNNRFITQNQKKIQLNDEDYHYYLGLIGKFEVLLRDFYNLYDIDDEVGAEDDISVVLKQGNKQSYDRLTSGLKNILGSCWASLANAGIKLYQSDRSEYSLNSQKLESCLKFYKYSIVLAYNESTVFQYALNLAVLRKTKECFKLLKYYLKGLKVKDAIYFKSWHLLALILSIEENKDESFKVISFLVNEINEFLNDSEIETISLSLKQVFIQVMATKLAIIEALFGFEQTLDTLPELFTLYNDLFNGSLESGSAQPIETKKPKSINNASNTITKIKSIRPHKKQEPQPETTTSTIGYRFKPSQTIAQKILQKIWVLSSIIYFKANLPKEAEQALLDAENCYHPTAETHTMLALLTVSTDANVAIVQFEKALTFDRYHMEAIIGLSDLFLNSPGCRSLFIDEKDEMAGIARVKLLLETISETFEGTLNSEVWWLLSLIYERFKDKKRLKESLWKSVELEESRAVRKFENVEGWF